MIIVINNIARWQEASQFWHRNDQILRSKLQSQTSQRTSFTVFRLKLSRDHWIGEEMKNERNLRSRSSRNKRSDSKKGSRKVLGLSSGVDPESLIITFIPLTIREAWQTSTNYSERWKIPLQLLRRYADSFADTVFCFVGSGGPRALHRLASHNFDRERSCRLIDRVTSLDERTRRGNLGVATDHNSLATAVCYIGSIDFSYFLRDRAALFSFGENS